MSASCAKADLATVSSGKLTIGTDNPAYPPWYAGGRRRARSGRSATRTPGKGFESAVAYAVAKQLGFSRAHVQWTYVPFAKSFAPGQEVVRLRHQPDLVLAGAREGRRLQQLVLRRQPGGRRPEGVEDRLRALDRRAARLQVRRPDRDDELRRDRQADQAGVEAGRLRHERQGRVRAEEQADRRPRRRPADRVLRHGRAGAERQDPRPAAVEAGRRALRDGASRRAARSPPA